MPMGHFPSSPGAGYPALRGLAEEELIRGTAADAESRRLRVVHTLTETGEELLDAQLAQPVAEQHVVFNFDHVILRFNFIDRLGRDYVVTFLGELAAEADRYVAALEELRDEMRPQMSVVNRLALEHGIQAYRGHARWARAAIDVLHEDEQGQGEHHG